MHRHQRRRQVLGRDVDRPPHRVRVDLGAQCGRQIGGQRIGGLQHGVDQGAELRAGREIGHRRDQIGTLGRGDQRDIGHLVIEFDDLRFATHPDALLRRAHQTGIGGPPPRGVDAAVEMPGGEVIRARVGGHNGLRTNFGLLDHRAAGRLPLPEPLQRFVIGDGWRIAAGLDRRLTGAAVAEQTGQSAVGLILGRRPPRHHLHLGPGHGHIDQPAVIAGALPAAQQLHRRVVRAVGTTDVQAPSITVVEQHQITVLHIAVEGEGQVDDRVLQTLTAVHRQHLHGGGIAIEAPVAFGAATALIATAAQPIPQGGQRVVLAVRGFLEQLRGVRHIGHIALPAAPRQQPIRHTAQARRLENRCHTVGSGVIGPLADGLGDAVGELIATGGKILGAVAEEHGGRSRPHHTRAVRLVEGLQQRQPVAARLGGVDVGITGVDGGDTRGGQCVETHPGIPALLDDHRDIAGPDRTAVEGGRAGQQRADLRGQILTDEGAQIVDGDLLGSPAAQCLPRYYPQPERVTMWRADQTAARVLGRDVMHHDARITEFGATQHGLEAVDERLVTAPVDAEGLLLPRGLRGLKVGDDIAAAECVDRLLRVTDQNHRRNPAEGVVDHLPLHRVGVLELIHHHDRPAPAHPHPRRGVGTVEGAGQAGEQIVVAEDAAAAFADFQFGQNGFRELHAHGGPGAGFGISRPQFG